jgi:hypothetical protein
MSEVRAVLQPQADSGPLVLFIDDLHLIDGTSATLVGQLVDADLVFLVATVRSNEVVPPGADSLWHRARVRRIDLEYLDRAAVDTLLHLVLGGPVDAVEHRQISLVDGRDVHIIHQRLDGVFQLVEPAFEFFGHVAVEIIVPNGPRTDVLAICAAATHEARRRVVKGKVGVGVLSSGPPSRPPPTRW